MKRIIALFFVCFFAGCGFPQQGSKAELIGWQRDFEKAKEIAKSENKPMMIPFYTDWCGWCKKLDSDTYSNKQVAELAKEFVCVKINAEQQQNLARDFNVAGFPYIVFLTAEGSQIANIPGYLPAERFFVEMKSALDKAKK